MAILCGKALAQNLKDLLFPEPKEEEEEEEDEEEKEEGEGGACAKARRVKAL